MRLLITGGAGFIGSNFVHYMLSKHSEAEIVVLDKLTYAGNMSSLKDALADIEFVKGDICDETIVKQLLKDCDCVINFAAETHVDRSITSSAAFVQTDVLGTHVLLAAAKDYSIERFVQISTDEVYGSIDRGSFKETDPLHPSSPYAASKAGADLLASSYFTTLRFSLRYYPQLEQLRTVSAPRETDPSLCYKRYEEPGADRLRPGRQRPRLDTRFRQLCSDRLRSPKGQNGRDV